MTAKHLRAHFPVTFPLPNVMELWQHRCRSMTTEPKPSFHAAPFLTTRWTRVGLAKVDSEEGRQALADLCDAYYEPVVAYLRCVLRDADAARDLSHAFFEAILTGGQIGAADPGRGRFRHYLLGAVKHFLAHHREAGRRLKRGGGVAPLSLDAEDQGSSAVSVADDTRLSPEAAFDRQWAVTVLARAVDALTAECAAQGKPGLVEQLRPWLLGESGYGDQVEAAQALGLSTPAMKALVHRLRGRFRQRVKAEIAGTLRDPAVVEDEMRALFAALGS